MSATDLYARALEALDHRQQVRALRLLEAALAQPAPADVRARILASRAYLVGETQSVDAGLAALAEAAAVPGISPEVVGLIAGNRGSMLLRAGSDEAYVELSRALSVLPQQATRLHAVFRINRGVYLGQHGQAQAAARDFDEAARTADGAGLSALADSARHNLGWALLVGGDVVGALRAIDAVAVRLSAMSPAFAGTIASDRARALLAAGLLAESARDLEYSVAAFSKARSGQDQAESQLTLAQVQLALGRAAEARATARAAARRFTRRGAEAWQRLAELAVSEADAALGSRRAATAARATTLARDLDQAGLPMDARRARLLAAQTLLDIPDADASRTAAAGALRLGRGDPLSLRLQARSVRSALAAAAGDERRADAELRAAVGEIQQHQAALGSLDLQTAAGVHVEGVARAGLARALRRGSPSGVFTWAELARGLSSRLSPPTRPSDPAAAAWLEELRSVRLELQRRRPTGAEGSRLHARAAELERLVRERSWTITGGARTHRPARLVQVRDALAPVGGRLVAHVDIGGRVIAVVVDGHRATLHRLPDAAVTTVVEAGRRLRADLDALASDHLPAMLRHSIASSAALGLDHLDELLVRPLRRIAHDAPLVLTPSAILASLPWSLLPSLRGRPVTVAVTATAWLRDRPGVVPETVVAVAGPELQHTAGELAAVGAVWPGAKLVPDATAGDVRSLAESADILHVAAHGTHEPQSPLFSHLSFADGPLFGHELHGLSRLPPHVVLSACELGRAEPRPGDESLGMTAALLAGGARSVVAGAASVSDAVAARVAAAHHAGLASGSRPAAALAAALATEPGLHADPETPPAPFVCFGSGW